MTLKERQEIIEKLVKNGFCTHYPGYVCDRDWSRACNKCINSWVIKNGTKEKTELEKYLC
jgi:hypothetical protein